MIELKMFCLLTVGNIEEIWNTFFGEFVEILQLLIRNPKD